MGERVSFKANGRTATGYLARPKGNGPGVIVIQEWWGLVPHIENVADRFAAEGFFALAPDLYHGEKTTSPDQAGKLMMSLRIDEAAKDLAGAIDHLLQQPGVTGSKVGTVGFCMGGALSLFAASQNPEVGACVVFYGGHPNVKPDLSKLQAPVLGIWAGKDGFVTPEVVERARQAAHGCRQAPRVPHLPRRRSTRSSTTRVPRFTMLRRQPMRGRRHSRFSARNSRGNSGRRVACELSQPCPHCTPPSSAQVLLVEDDDSAREILAKALRMTGYQVRTAADGLAGLRLLEAFEPDVVVVDLVLPDRERLRGARRAACGRAHAPHSRDRHLRQRERTRAGAIQSGILRHSREAVRPAEPRAHGRSRASSQRTTTRARANLV